MAKTEKSKKRKHSKEPVKQITKKPTKTKKDKLLANMPDTISTPPESTDSDTDDSSLPSDSDSDASIPDTDDVRKLLEPFSKEQLIDFVADAAVKGSSLYNRIRDMADSDISNRKIFVHGLGWDTTRETLKQVFESYGEIEDINLVTDRNTGKTKGFAFLSFKTRKATEKALKQPRKKINNRFASCQLASVGPVPSQQNQDASERKIYVSNVQTDVDSEKLRSFFAKFGEIETGPIGFDMYTGKSRGFALFLYKTEDGARKALAEPYKLFDGIQLHCQKAADGKNKSPAISAAQPTQAPVLAAAQNLMVNQQPGLNPMYSRLIATPNAGFFGGSMNPMMGAGAFSPGMIPTSQVGVNAAMGLGSYGIVSPSVLGTYGSNAAALGLQQAYPNTQMGQAPQLGQATSARGNTTGGSFSGYPSQMWLFRSSSAGPSFPGRRKLFLIPFLDLKSLITELEAKLKN